LCRDVTESVPGFELNSQYLPWGVKIISYWSLRICAYLDPDHVGDLDSRRSVTAFAIVGNGVGSSRCNLLSSMEAEYMALC